MMSPGDVLRYLAGILLVLSMPAWACPRTDCLRVATWNLEWLGSDKRALPSDNATVERMADLISQRLSIDLIVLEEVNTELEGQRHNEQFSLQPWRHLQETLGQLGYRFQSGKSGYAQHIVLAWRAPVTQLEAAHELAVADHFDLDSTCHSAHLRKPLAAKFHAGKTDFWLVGVHLKAHGTDRACSNAIHRKQVEQLSTELAAMENTAPALLLAGDFNATAHHADVGMLDTNFETLDDKDHRNPASGKTSYVGDGHSNGHVIDHLLISHPLATQWIPASTMIYKPDDTASFAQMFSDHVPVWADFSLATPE